MDVMLLKYCKSPVSRKLKRGLGRVVLQQMLIVDNPPKMKMCKISLNVVRG